MAKAKQQSPVEGAQFVRYFGPLLDALRGLGGSGSPEEVVERIAADLKLSDGMYDLYPVSLSARAGYVKFTPEMIEKLSPLRHLDKLVAPVIVAHGTLETPEFQRQNRDFAAAVKTAGKPVTFLIGQGYNHFEMFETLGNPYGLLGRAMLEQMKLKTA